jgi:hypothetical protein
MKRWITLLGILLLAAAALAQETKQDINIEADVNIGPKPGTTESLTVIQPGPDGSTRIMSQEVVKEPEVREPRPEVAPDETPRKARVVVVPAIFAQDVRSKFERELNEKWGLTDPSVLENPGYTAFLVDALVNSRRFDVLEREDLRSVIKEIDFGESDYADLAKVVRIGQMVNADYVVIPEIRYMGLIMIEKDVPYVGQQSRRLKGKLSTGIRVVDVKTSKIASSSMSDMGATNSLRRAEESPGSPVKDLIDALYGGSALQEAARITDIAYPIKVVAVAEATCVLNRGEGAIQEGDLLNVYSPGEVMIDPDTKENLGFHEARVGKVKVAKVDPKTCTADILEGAGQIQKSFIARRDLKPEPMQKPPPMLGIE